MQDIPLRFPSPQSAAAPTRKEQLTLDAEMDGSREAEEKAEKTGEALPAKVTVEGKKELRIVLKADVSGSAEAVEGALSGIGNHLAVTNIVSTSVGDVSESDVLLASAVDGKSFPAPTLQLN